METYIIGFEGELRGHDLRVEFIEFIRDEKRFENINALKAQITNDIEKAKKILESVINIKGVLLKQ